MHSNSKNKNNAVSDRQTESCTVPRKAIAVALAACFSGAAVANPTGGTVVHGSAQITNPAVNVLNINTLTPKTIINWNSFSIGAGELTRITQPTALSAVLNRVVGSDPSAILGSLQSNGRVFLLNPNGIVFGAGAQINVAGLVASTLNLSDADFLSGRMNFTNGVGAGSVVNQGSINAAGGPVYLVGNSVTNNGLITNPNGEVVLAAGNSVELVNPATPNLRVEIVAPDNAAKNLGTISAEAGRIGIYAGLIQQGGTVNASSAVVEGGRILLKATKNTTLDAGSQTLASGTTGGKVEIQSGDTTLASGTIEAKGSSGAGGGVHLLGNKVGLLGNTTIDASGETGGGTVLVGGDFQGKNADVQNAFRTFVGKDVSIKADAITQGHGGKVIIWANDATRFYGSVHARGGAAGGDGGFVEVSGKHALDFSGYVNTLASGGRTGTLLLDPDFIDISLSGTASLTSVDQFADLPANQIISPSTINNAATNVVLQANNDINVNDAISMSNTGVGITMQAGAFLNVSAPITTKGGVINLVAGDPGSLTSPNEGALYLNAALNTTGGGVTAGANIILTSNLSDVGGNSMQLAANINAGTNGVVSLNNSNADIDQTAGVITAKTIEAFNTAPVIGRIILSGNNAADFVELSTSTVAPVTFRNTRLNSTLLAADSGGNITITNSNSNATVNLAGDVNFGASSTFSIDGSLLTSSGTRTITGGTFSSSKQIEVTGGQLNLSNTTNTLTDLVVSGGTLSNTSAMSVSGTMSFGGGVISGAGALNSGVGSIATISGATAKLTGKTWNNGGTMTITGAGRLLLDGGATLNNQAGGLINIDSTSTATNPIFFSSGANTFNNAGILNKNSAVAQTLNVNGAINNTGTMHVATGQLDLANNGTHTGTFDIDPGTALRFTGGTHNLNSGTVFTDTGAFHVTGGTVNVNTSLTFGATNPAVAISGGTISGPGNLTFVNGFNWTNGVIAGTGTLTTPAGSVTTISPGFAQTTALRGSRAWTNAGTVTFTPNPGTLSYFQVDDSTGDGTAVFNNSSGGVFNINASFSDTHIIGVGTFNNAGVLNKNLNSTVAVVGFEPVFNNTAGGVVNVNSGTLRFDAGGTDAGNYAMTSGSTLHFNGGPRSITGDIAGAGNVRFSKPLTGTAVYTVAGGYDVGGATSVALDDLGTGTLAFTGTISNLGIGYLQNGAVSNVDFSGIAAGEATGFANLTTMIVNGGNVTLKAGTSLAALTSLTRSGAGVLDMADSSATLSALTVSGGTLTGTGGMAVGSGGNFTWTNGAIGGTGTLTTQAGSTTTLSPGFAQTASLRGSRSWQNAGVITFTPNPGTLSYFEIDNTTGDGNAVFNNAAGGIFNINASFNDTHIIGVGGFNNAGVLNKNLNSTAATSAINPVFNNQASGIVNVNSGVLRVNAFASGSNSGTIDIDPGAALSTNSANLINSATGVIQGGGNVNVGTATLTNNGTIRPGTSPGLLSVTGNLSLGSGSVLDIEINGVTRGTQYDAIDVTGNVTLGGTMNVGYGAFTPVAGNQFSIIQAAGTVGGSFATINDPNALTQQITAGPAGIFKLGLFTGALTWDGGASTLNWLDALNWSGDYVPTSANDVVIGTGVGTVLVSGVAEAKSLNAASPLTLSSGSLTLTNPSQVNDLFTISGGSLLGSGSVVIGGSSGALAWSGGTMGAGGLFTLGSGRSGSLSGTLALNRTFQNDGILNVSGSTLSGSGSIINAGSANFLSGAVNVNLPFSATGLTTINSATVAFNGGSPVNLLNVNMSGGAMQGSDNVTVGGVMNLTGGSFAGSGTLTTPPGATTNVNALVGLAANKVWNNGGTVNIGGTGTIDLGDFTPAVFNNQSGGTVNITSTAGWSFISNPSTQVGQINNAGTINVNENTSWEAAFNNAAGGMLHITGGKFLSMQNGQNISGSLNIGPGGTLWVSERHGFDTVFNNVAIGGNGTLQVLGSSPVAKFTNVSAPGVTLHLGTGGQIGVVNGSASFAGLTLASPGLGASFSLSDGVFAQTTGNLNVPSGASYSGSNNVYVAQAGDLIVPGLVSASPGSSMTLAAPAGNVKIIGGSVMADVINLFGSNVAVGDSSASAPSQVVAANALTVQTQGTLKILGGLGAGASALVSSSGALSVSTDGDVIVAGGSGAGAWAKLSGNPDVVLAMIGGAVRMDAGTGSGAYAKIESVSALTIHADFPFLASGGYFVNGVEGVVYDAATGTGFVAGGSPAILNSNLLVTYGLTGGTGALSGVLEDALEVPTQTLIVATTESTKPPEAEKEKNVFNEDKKEKKKEAPVCK